MWTSDQNLQGSKTWLLYRPPTSSHFTILLFFFLIFKQAKSFSCLKPLPIHFPLPESTSSAGFYHLSDDSSCHPTLEKTTLTTLFRRGPIPPLASGSISHFPFFKPSVVMQFLTHSRMYVSQEQVHYVLFTIQLFTTVFVWAWHIVGTFVNICHLNDWLTLISQPRTSHVGMTQGCAWYLRDCLGNHLDSSFKGWSRKIFWGPIFLSIPQLHEELLSFYFQYIIWIIPNVCICSK